MTKTALHRGIAGAGAGALVIGRAALELWGVYVATWAGIVRRFAGRRVPGRPHGELAHQL